MDPDRSTQIVVLLVLILLYAFFAAAETSLTTISRSRLNQLSKQGHRAAQLITRLTLEPIQMMATTQLILKLAAFVAAGLATVTFVRPIAEWILTIVPSSTVALGYSLSVVLVAAALTLIFLFFGELIPKSLAAQVPEPFAFLAVYPISLAALVGRPLARLSTAISRRFTGNQAHLPETPPSFVTEEQIKTMVDAGEEEGVIEEEEREMIYSIFELGDTLAREVMVPRIDTVAIEVKTSIPDALSVIVEAGHSRIPVFRETIDNIVGILYAKDLLKYWPDIEHLEIKEMLRPGYFIPETKKVDELLQELQQRQVHIAVVVDEYGGTAGLVTIEDILEEIVGEIQDEYDSEEASVEIISPDEAIFDGLVDLDDINHTMRLNFPTDSADTVGGLIYTRLGRVPVVGDKVDFDDAELTVLSVSGRRVKKVKAVRRAVQPQLPVAENGQSWLDSVVNGKTESTESPPAPPAPGETHQSRIGRHHS